MNRRILLLGGAGAAGTAAVVGGVVLVAALTGTPAPEPYVASDISDLRVVQQAAHDYDVSFALPDGIPATGGGVAIEVTDSPDYRAGEAEELDFTIAGDRIQLETTRLGPGDHFVWITADDTQVSGAVTIPDMAPRVWLDGATPHLEFGESGEASWSSYVDPEGKNVYRGASPVFGADAEPLAENLPITETAYRVDDPDAERPYYFLVFTGRGGDATFVSSPIVADATQGQLTVELTAAGGEPRYVIEGFLAARRGDVERSHALRVGNFDPADPGATFFVESSAEDSSDGRFRFEVPALELEPGWSDLAVFLTEDGSTLEWSLDATGVDLDQRLATSGSVFGLRRVEALQLTRIDLVYDRLDVALAASGSSAVLRVTGGFTEAASGVGYELVVKDTTGESHIVRDASAGARPFSYTLDLAALDQAGVWYDVEFRDPATGATSPISTLSVRDMRQWVATEQRTYAFADYDGLLKVFFDAKPFANAQVSLETVGGIPSLVATGDLVGVANSDAVLRIRSGSTTIADIANSSATRGQFRFVFDVSRLPTAGTWYDLVFRQPSAGRTIDFGVAAADLAQTLATTDREYGFRDWNGLLKVTFDAIAGTVAVDSSEIVDVAGTPTLRVTGMLDRLAAADAALRIRSGSEVFQVANTATAAGAALFEFDLTRLTQAGAWYDVLVGSVSADAFADVAAASADLSAALVDAGREYAFHEWDTQLKVAFEELPGEVVVTSSELVDVSGVPTLRVTGTLDRVAADDAVLRIRSGSEVFDVVNTATTAGEALFEFDLSGLTTAGAWYDVLVGDESTGTFTDVAAATADLAQTVMVDARAYGFHEWSGQLKVAYEDVVLAADSASLVDVAGVPTLRVTGTIAGTSASDAFLRIRTTGVVIDVPNTSATAGEVLFEYDLSGLAKPGTWYDLLVGLTSTGQLADLTPSLADMTQTIEVADREYGFRQWDGDLKVVYADTAPAATVTSVELLDVSGTPTLRVSGTIANTTNSDVFVRLRTTGESFDVANSSATAGQLRADFALGSLTKSGTWYDLLVGVTSRGTTAELSQAVANMSQTVVSGARTYAFHEWYSALKVAYDETVLGSGQSIRIDFGPDDVTNGHATPSPDANGRYWNNMTWQGGSSNSVPANRAVSTLVTTGNIPTATKVTMNGSNWKSNGLTTGGLKTPSAALLGEYAIATVTEDYFFVESSGTATLTLSGLDPWLEYDIKLFGTRDATGVRKTTYTAVGGNGTQQTVLQTSGTGIGVGGYNGNNSTIATIQDVQPNPDGTIQVKVGSTSADGTFGYLAFLEITGDTTLTPIPAEVRRWVDQDAADPVADDSVLFIGSSSIRRWETLTRDFADYDVIQRGWGGSWLTGVNEYSPWVAWPYQPRAIVMWAGTNDINGGQSAAHVLTEYRKFVTNMRANSPGSDLFWISMTPNPGNADKNAVRMQANALVKAEIEADSSGKLHYIDVATYFESVRDSNPTLFASYYVDSLHMTRAGYAKWLEVVRPALAAVVPPNKAVTSNPSALQAGEELFFDFGPSNASEGDPTTTDGNGNRWNNWVPTTGGGLVNVGEHIAGLVDSTGRPTGIGMTIAAGFQVNGKTTGGLLAPDASLLGDLAVATATEDFFYSSADGVWGGSDDDLPGGFMMTGLDPALEYEFRFFGSRSATETRVTEYAVYGANSGSAQLTTSGTGISHDGTKNGNDSEIAVVSGIRPDAFGQVWVDLTVKQGSFAYLNSMQVIAAEPGAAPLSLLAAEDEELGLLGVEDGEGLDEESLGERASGEEPAGAQPSGAEPSGALGADAGESGEGPAAGEPTPAPAPAPTPAPDPTPAPSDPAVVPGGATQTRTGRPAGSGRPTGRRR